MPSITSGNRGLHASEPVENKPSFGENINPEAELEQPAPPESTTGRGGRPRRVTEKQQNAIDKAAAAAARKEERDRKKAKKAATIANGTTEDGKKKKKKKTTTQDVPTSALRIRVKPTFRKSSNGNTTPNGKRNTPRVATPTNSARVPAAKRPQPSTSLTTQPRLAPSRLAAPPVSRRADTPVPMPNYEGLPLYQKMFASLCELLPIDQARRLASENFSTIEALTSTSSRTVTAAALSSTWDSMSLNNNTPSESANIGDKRPRANSSASDYGAAMDCPPAPKVQKIDEPDEAELDDSDGSDVVLEEVDPKNFTLIMNQAIVRYKSKLVTECAYPEPEDNDKFARQAWKAARDDLKLSPNYRITPAMMKKIQRTATSWRSNLKEVARAVVGPIFGRHSTKADNARLAQDLLANHTYIYLESEHAMPNEDRISLYENTLILAMIMRQWFSSKYTLGVRRAEDFGTRMPLGTIAFASTLICWAISEWLTGEFVGSTFGENDYQKINKYHKDRLTIMEKSSADAEMLLSTPNLFDARRKLWMSNARKGVGLTADIDNEKIAREMEEATFRAQLNASLTQTTTPAIALQAAPTNWNTEDYDEPAAAPEDDEEDFLSEEVVHMPVKPKCKKGKGKGKANAKAALEVAPPRLEPEVNISAMPGKDVNAANTDASESTPHVNEAEEEEDEDEEDEENEEEDEEEVDGDAAEDSDEEEDLEEEEDSEEEESEEE